VDVGRNWIKLLLILISIAARHVGIGERFEYFDWSLGLLLYLSLLLVFTALLLLCGWIGSAKIRWPIAALLALFALPVIAYEQSMQSLLDYFKFVTMVNSSSAAGDAIGMFPGPIIFASLSSLMLFFGIGLRPVPLSRLPRVLPILAPLAGAAAISALLVVRFGDGSAGLPPSWSAIGYASLYMLDYSQGKAGPRQPVRLSLTHKAEDGDIILIVDESVAGAYLDINNPAGVHSGLKSPPGGADIANFGLASSITNCSIGTNVALRFGATRDRYQETIATMPSIWSYAKNAGYRTVYIYGQQGGFYENYMTDAERRGIDVSRYFDKVSRIDRDQHVARTLSKFINDGKRDFILVNKYGVHFPVTGMYPPAYDRHQPVIGNGQKWSGFAKWSKVGDPFMKDDEDWKLYRNNYRNALEWNVGAFFKTLFSAADFSKTLLIYTSDHGQTMHERDEPTAGTHCNGKPVLEEVIVPLVAVNGGKGRRIDWSDAARRNFSRSSHFRIFPSLLIEMGYDWAGVEKLYGHALDAKVPDSMASIPTMVRWRSNEIRWFDANARNVVFPPTTDGQPAIAR
jgi:Sulfatase